MHVLHPSPVTLPDTRRTLMAAAAALAVTAGLVWADSAGTGSDSAPAAAAPTASAAPAPARDRSPGVPVWRADPLAPVTIAR